MGHTFKIILSFVGFIALTACSDVNDFVTAPGQVYRGTVFGTTSPDECDEPDGCSFIRRGFAERTVLELSFTPHDETHSGFLTTKDETCGATFDNVPLRRIEPLQHDALSLLDFPGEGRLETYIFLATPDTGPLAGRTATVFLSLMRSGSIEVRLIAGTGSNRCDPADCTNSVECDYFGVFALSRPE